MHNVNVTRKNKHTHNANILQGQNHTCITQMFYTRQNKHVHNANIFQGKTNKCMKQIYNTELTQTNVLYKQQ